MIPEKENLFATINRYRKLRSELQDYLSKHPDGWLKFQEKFNTILDEFSQDILRFEKDNIAKSEDKVYQLKKIFEKRYRKYFLCGDFVKWSFEKPFGYPGDFKIIDDIYLNQPHTVGFDRLWDNYFQQLSASKATRERKEDFKKIIFDFVKQCKSENVRIMNLASGPVREIKELLEVEPNIFSKVTFDCYELDDNAISYAQKLLDSDKNVNFIKKNAIRLALKKDVKQEVINEYDMIYSAGLFDYLDERIATRLIINLKKTLKKDGVMCISNYTDKHSNSSAYLMEWVAEWNLIYRNKEDFRQLFLNAGFSPSQIKIMLQDSKVMQYCFARAE